jgi:cell division protein FtsB
MKSDPIYVPKTPFGGWSGKHTAWKLSGKAMGVLVLLLLLGSLIGSFYLNQASQTTAAGLETLKLTREREYWRQENAELRKQIAQMESLARIRARAEELGFVEAEKVEYLVVRSPSLEHLPVDTSSRRASSDRGLPGPATPQPTDWWGELAAQFQSWMELQH